MVMWCKNNKGGKTRNHVAAVCVISPYTFFSYCLSMIREMRHIFIIYYIYNRTTGSEQRKKWKEKYTGSGHYFHFSFFFFLSLNTCSRDHSFHDCFVETLLVSDVRQLKSQTRSLNLVSQGPLTLVTPWLKVESHRSLFDLADEKEKNASYGAIW